jgi:hypothetical protein
MTPEQRFEKIDRTLEWVAERQALFMTELEAMQKKHDRAYAQGRRMVLALLCGIRRSERRLRAEMDARMNRHLDDDHDRQ